MSESAALLQLARRLDDHAATVRARAQRLGRAGAEMHWRGVAADAFRHRADDSAAMLNRSARAIEHAAGALRRHAHTVRHLEQVAEAALAAGETLANGAKAAGRALTGMFS